MMTWTNITAKTTGLQPEPRYGHGFASSGGKLYLFGGQFRDGLQIVILDSECGFELDNIS